MSTIGIPRRVRVVAGCALLALSASAGGAVAGAAGVAGGDDSARADRASLATLAKRKVTAAVSGTHDLLILPGLGRLRYTCAISTAIATVEWLNDRSYPIDAWSDLATGNDWHGSIIQPGDGLEGARMDHTHHQRGSTLHLGQGNNPGPRRMADVRIHVYRETTGQPCGFDVIATTWSSE